MSYHKYHLTSISVDSAGLDILESYEINGARIYITRDGKYLVNEPYLPEDGGELYNSILSRMDLTYAIREDSMDPGMLEDKFEIEFWATAARLKRQEEARRDFANLSYYSKRNMLGFDILDVLQRDPHIEDILCSAPARPVRIIHNQYSGRFHTLETNIMFEDELQMRGFIQKTFSKTGSEPTESIPISVTYMKDGSRISCTFGSQVTKPGPIIAIRKFPESPITITGMIQSKTISLEAAAYMWTLFDAQAVGLVIGATGSGKTTLMSAMMTMLNPSWRILTIEDTLELRVPHADWVRYNTRKSYGMLSDKFNVTIRHLIDSSLTQRPDFEIVGEIRVDDMDSLFQAVGTGHGGLTSFHAYSPYGAITRLRGNGIGDGEISLLWFVVHARKINIRQDEIITAVRRVNDISEVVPNKDGSIRIDKIYEYFRDGDIIKRIKPLNESQRYVEATDILGIINHTHDMDIRMKLLNRCVTSKANKPEEIFKILGTYYQ